MTNHAAAFSFTTYPIFTAHPGLSLIPALNLRKPAQAPLTSAAPEYKDP